MIKLLKNFFTRLDEISPDSDIHAFLGKTAQLCMSTDVFGLELFAWLK